jgi:hypothetical protein
MGAFADATKNQMLDALVGRTTYTANAAFYCKLHIGSPGAAGTSNVAGETTRQAATFGSAAASGAISNTVAVTWTNLSTAETISHVSFWTASSGGTFLGADDLPTTKTVAIGDSLTVAIGDLDLTISGTLP